MVRADATTDLLQTGSWSEISSWETHVTGTNRWTDMQDAAGPNAFYYLTVIDEE